MPGVVSGPKAVLLAGIFPNIARRRGSARSAFEVSLLWSLGFLGYFGFASACVCTCVCVCVNMLRLDAVSACGP